MNSLARVGPRSFVGYKHPPDESQKDENDKPSKLIGVMKTYLKLQVYVEVSTGNVDRLLVSKAIQQRFFPLVLDMLSKGKLSKQEWNYLQELIPSLDGLSLLSEQTFLQKTLKPKKDSFSFLNDDGTVSI